MIGERVEVNLDGGLDVPLPRMVNVRQKFQTTRLESVSRAVAEQFKRPEVRAKIKPGQTIAIGCGSRGVANIAEAAKAVVEQIQALGGKPFIFPAMGSHGAATAEGQKQLLEGYGITQAYTGVPIRATMDTVELGRLDDGMPVYMDRYAAEADGVVLINRVKPHTDFHAAIESGTVKMMVIGMGKIKGATALHAHGVDRFGETLPLTARLIMAKKNILLGVALVENAHKETALLEAMPAQDILAREPQLLAQAKQMLARLHFDEIDLLVVEEMGKNISGAGMDPNVTGRNSRYLPWERNPRIGRIVVLGLTEATHGNAIGVGLADVITMKLFRAIDPGPTYANVITSTPMDAGAIPVVMNTEQEAICVGLKTVPRVKPAEARIVRIRNTQELTHIQVSEPMLDEVRRDPQRFEVLGAPFTFRFDDQGNLRSAISAA